MDGSSETGNGRSSVAEGSVLWDEVDRAAWRGAGFFLPEGPVVLDSLRIAALINEGWRIVFDWEGVVVAYLPPLLIQRIEMMGKMKRASARSYPMSDRSWTGRERVSHE